MSQKIELSEEALAALKASGFTPPPEPLPLWMQVEIREQVRETFFGRNLKPPFKIQCLGWTSFRAIKAVWAADHFERMNKEKYG